MVVRLQQPVQHKHAWITANIFIFQKDMWAKHFQPSTLSQKWMPFIYNCDPTKPRQKNTMVVFILLMKICWPKGSQIWTCTFFQLRPWWDHACKFPFLQKEMLVKHASCRMVSCPKKSLSGLYAIQKSCSFPKLGCGSLGSYRPRNRASIHSLRKALEFLMVLHVDMAFLLIHL